MDTTEQQLGSLRGAVRRVLDRHRELGTLCMADQMELAYALELTAPAEPDLGDAEVQWQWRVLYKVQDTAHIWMTSTSESAALAGRADCPFWDNWIETRTVTQTPWKKVN